MISFQLAAERWGKAPEKYQNSIAKPLATLENLHAMSSKCLTEQERRGLCEVLYHAFIDLRGMYPPERSLQASKLAYALHNLPHLLYADNFEWEKVEGPLRYYQGQFYESETTRGYDYLKMIAQIRRGEPVSP